MSAAKKPFVRRRSFDAPTLVGARWWRASAPTFGGAAKQGGRPSRRSALKALLAFAGVAGVGGALTAALVRACKKTEEAGPWTPVTAEGLVDGVETRELLAVQREHGWATGARDLRLDFVDRATGDAVGGFPSFEGLAAESSPPSEALRAYYDPTLFQVLEGPGGASLRTLLAPIDTPAMRRAYETGAALGSLFAAEDATGPAPRGIALVIDLEGPESVAMAAGLIPAFQPVFVFGNWPHPSGVVPAHLTLAAAIFHRPHLKRAPADALPAFVLDRARLRPYGSDPTLFDNRYVAGLPSPFAMKRLGLDRALYVSPDAERLLESDDLNDDLVGWRESGVDVRLVSIGDFDSSATEVEAALAPPEPEGPEAERSATRPASERRRYFGGSPGTHVWFWHFYPWRNWTPPVGAVAPTVTTASTYVPRPRSTPFSTGLPGGASGETPKPPGFGKVAYRGSTGGAGGSGASRSGSRGRSWFGGFGG
jgi:hypothetical protein